MSVQDGRKLQLQVGDGNAPVEGFSTIGSLQVSALDVRLEPHDASHAGSGPWRKLHAVGGQRHVRVEGDGLFANEAAEALLRSYALGGVRANYVLRFGNGEVLEAPCLITRYERGGRVDEAEAFALVLESAGEVRYY